MEETFIQKGDIIVFDNKHKIYCGDCTLKESYDFMKDEIATMCFTSPPYNVGGNNCESGKNAKYQTKKYKEDSKKYYGNDDKMNQDDYLNMIYDSSNNALEHCKYLFYNVGHTSGNKLSLIGYLYKMRNKFVDTIVWKKTTSLPAIEPNVLNCDFEYIYVYTNIENNGKHIRIGEDFRGTKSNVIECNRNMQNEYASIHSALMPIELCDKLITNFTNENDMILDCFSGLGTNMISCMKNNRIYRGIELSPYYCQETINRYLKYKVDDYDVKIIRNGEIIDFKDVKNEIINEYTLFTI